MENQSFIITGFRRDELYLKGYSGSLSTLSTQEFNDIKECVIHKAFFAFNKIDGFFSVHNHEDDLIGGVYNDQNGLTIKIFERHQHKGYGVQALLTFCNYLFRNDKADFLNGECESALISTIKYSDTSTISLYRSAGFIKSENGEGSYLINCTRPKMPFGCDTYILTQERLVSAIRKYYYNELSDIFSDVKISCVQNSQSMR